MNLREIITGTTIEKDARKTVKELREPPRLNARQQHRLSAAQPISRRLFIRQMGIIGGATILSAGAMIWKINSGTTIQATSANNNNYLTPEPNQTPEVKDEKQFITQALRELPSSPIKDIISSRVLPFLGSFPPSSYDAFGVKVPVHGFKVKLEETDDDPSPTGTFNQYVENNKVPLVTLTKDVSTITPYLGLRMSTDNESYTTAPDGTYLIPFANKAGDKMTDGISPLITVRTFSDQYMKKLGNEASQKLLQDRVKAIAVKESIQFAMIQIMAKLMVEKMFSLGLPTTVEVEREDGSIDQIGFVTNSIESLSNLNGRFMAVMDAAATVVMIKAYSSQEINRILGNTSLGKATRALANVDLGTDEDSILLNSLQWVLNNPVGQTIFHYGQFEKIP